MGRQYEYDEWLEFLTGSDEQPRAAKKNQQYFEDRIEYLVDKYLPDDEPYPDIKEVSYLSFASLMDHGVGLWEGKEPWHRRFEGRVKRDLLTNKFASNIEEHAAYDEDLLLWRQADD